MARAPGTGSLLTVPRWHSQDQGSSGSLEVSPRTAAKHLEHIYRKLVSSRVAQCGAGLRRRSCGPRAARPESPGDALTGPALAGA